MMISLQKLVEEYGEDSLLRASEALNIELQPEYEESDPVLNEIATYLNDNSASASSPAPTPPTPKKTRKTSNSTAIAKAQEKQTQAKGALVTAQQKTTKAGITVSQKAGVQAADQMAAAKLTSFLDRTAQNENQFGEFILEMGHRCDQISDETAQSVGVEGNEEEDFFAASPMAKPLTGMYSIDF